MCSSCCLAQLLQRVNERLSNLQVTPPSSRRVVDFGALVMEGLRAQEMSSRRLALGPASDTGAPPCPQNICTCTSDDFPAFTLSIALLQSEMQNFECKDAHAESDEEPEKMGGSVTACPAPLKWSPAGDARMARLVAAYADGSQGTAEAEDSAWQDELHNFLAQHRVVKPALQSGSSCL